MNINDLRDYNPNISDPNEIKAVDTVNDNYSKLIRYGISLESNSGGFMNAITEANIQQLVYDTYEYFMFKLNKKTGMLHQSLLGKNIDYATRSVISAPRVAGAKDTKHIQVPFGYVGVPLSQIIVLFYPFFLNYIQNYVAEHESELANFTYNGKEIKINNVREQFAEEKIKKMMDLYIKSAEHRFQPIKIKDVMGKEYPVNLYKKDLGRHFTLTDLFYLAAYDILGRDKNSMHVYVTRYPIEVHQNIFPNRISILSTKETKMQKLENRYLPDYPVVYDTYAANDETFVDTVRMNNA